MKKSLIALLAILFQQLAFSQQQIFDILSYNIPKGWKVEKKNETACFSKNGGSKGYCIITLYKSIDAGNNSKQNFDLSWENLVENTLHTGNPAMQPVSNDDGWETQVGSAAFENNDLKGTAILMSSTQSSKLVNILILVNGNTFINEMQTFLETIKINKPASETIKTTTAANKNQPITTPKHEVWRVSRYSPVLKRNVIVFFIRYANGDCMRSMPEEGIIGLSRSTDKRKYSQWGVAKDAGNEVHATYGTEVVRLVKVSATKMKYCPDCSATFYYKCLPVDGLILEGEWSSGGIYSNPNWYKDPNFKEGTIRFYKDGRFENKGGLQHMRQGQSGYESRKNGNGTYYVKDFTIVMTYSDGEVWTSALTGLDNTSPLKNNTTLYFHSVPFYKKII